nr:hypothetical protein [Sphingomonas sp. PP-CE-3G-477]
MVQSRIAWCALSQGRDQRDCVVETSGTGKNVCKLKRAIEIAWLARDKATHRIDREGPFCDANGKPRDRLPLIAKHGIARNQAVGCIDGSGPIATIECGDEISGGGHRCVASRNDIERRKGADDRRLPLRVARVFA